MPEGELDGSRVIDASRANVLVPTKDETGSYPVPTQWRATFREIVRALVEGDDSLSRGLPNVRPVSDSTMKQMRSYVTDYGETLVTLPDDTWRTSEVQWTRSHWDVLVDLWTAGEGRSDMVLGARVFETAGGYEIAVDLVYVP